MRGRGLRWAGLAIAAVTVVLAVVLASRFGTDPSMVEGWFERLTSLKADDFLAIAEAAAA